MRRAEYIALLLALLIVGLTGTTLWLDGLTAGFERPAWWLSSGAWIAAFSAVSLAEEVSEWLFRERGLAGIRGRALMRCH